MPNRLIDQNSPYLLQHAENPVEWYPWGQDALDEAQRQDKPIFLSIGYAACHWCHVMAHESFEDPNTAALMNEHFINIKVDREERPDLDGIYMNAVVAMTGQGGWPMSVFLTPNGEPFYGGTYYPPTRRYNIPSFTEILLAVSRTWQSDRQGIENSARKISEHLERANQTAGTSQALGAEDLEKAAFTLVQAYDWKFGGWGSAPKFPQAMAVEFLLRRANNGDQLARDVSVHALTSMSTGGMYDVIGGGFARYSTDNNWLVPHFEKMLYDNGLLSRAYLHAYLITGDEHFKKVCTSTLDFILRELTHPRGGFFSSLDADSEGEEGKFYVWSADEIRGILCDATAYQLFSNAYSLPESGNFEGRIVLQRTASDRELAEKLSISPTSVEERLDSMHLQLLQAREERIRPTTDDKILTSWNALALLAFAESARYLNRADYLAVARSNASFLLDELYQKDRLLRSWRDGSAQHNAYLEDYASLILGLLALYQSDFDLRWYNAAERLTQEMLDNFTDPDGGFYDTRQDHDWLLTRPKDTQDNATPSGNSLACQALIHMAAYTGKLEWLDTAGRMLEYIISPALRYPTAFSNWLCAADTLISGVKEVALIGEFSNTLMQDYIKALWGRYRPNLVVTHSALPVPDNSPPLLMERGLQNNLPTAYICRQFVCQQPTNSAVDFISQLDKTTT